MFRSRFAFGHATYRRIPSPHSQPPAPRGDYRKKKGIRSRSSRLRADEGPNENKMSDGGREPVSVGVEVWKSSQKWSEQRSAVRSIAWLDDFTRCKSRHIYCREATHK